MKAAEELLSYEACVQNKVVIIGFLSSFCRHESIVVMWETTFIQQERGNSFGAYSYYLFNNWLLLSNDYAYYLTWQCHCQEYMLSKLNIVSFLS
jgi:hypothetical protein